VRVVALRAGEPLRSCAAGVCALWGPLHGGANVEVVEMLRADPPGRNLPEECLRDAKDKSKPFRSLWLRPPGLRKLRPRAKILKERLRPGLCQAAARAIRSWTSPASSKRLALADPYFVERSCTSNVDFYSGSSSGDGIPTNMFTVCFAIGRLPGWIAQWKEQHEDPSSRIFRPRQIYLGRRRRLRADRGAVRARSCADDGVARPGFRRRCRGPALCVQWRHEPEPRPAFDPRIVPAGAGTLVLAFSGWMDGGDVSTGTVSRLVHLLDARAIAEIDPEPF